MFNKVALVLLSTLAVAFAQQVGTLQTETHPRLPWQKCTRSGCQTQSNGSITLDANWRWFHSTQGYSNCYTGAAWNTTVCTNGKTCAQNCAVEGANYSATYGITTSGNQLSIKFLTKSDNTNVGARVYLMNSDSKYEMFHLLNKEFTFDVDVSKVPCGINGALYFVEMEEDGGLRHTGNKAGAKYGTGYCDSQCARDIKFINGEANVAGWKPSETDPNAGVGNWGACCAEMDIWEANKISTAYTPHPCTELGLVRCEGSNCPTAGRYNTVCDPDGCDFNSFRLGERSFYGEGAANTIDTSKKMTVVTQFITHNGQDNGDLVEIRRLYVQNGQIINNSRTKVPGVQPYDSVTEGFCTNVRKAFDDYDSFGAKGGMSQMGKSLAKGHVLVMSIWDDHFAHMLWLDSNYPTDADPNKPGIARGTCPITSGDPKDVEANEPNSQILFSNIKFGEIGSTYSGTAPPTTPVPPITSNPPVTSLPPTTTVQPPITTTIPSGPTQTPFGQCGGIGYSGPTVCATGYNCVALNVYYSQCQR